MIADFLNKPLSDELINRIADQCTLGGMKKNITSYTFHPEQTNSPLLRKLGWGLEKLLHTRAE